MSKLLKQNLIAIGVLIALTVAIFIATRFVNVAEILSRHVYFDWAEGINYVTAFIPFSTFEVEAFLLAAIVLGLIIVMIIQFVHKKKEAAFTILTSIILLITLVIFIYSLLVMPLYNRQVLDIKEQQELLDNDKAYEIANKYLDDFNKVASLQTFNEDGTTICPYTDEELEDKIREEYKKLESSYFSHVDPEPKKIVSSYLMSAFGIAGITFIPDVEPCYNMQMLSIDKTITIAHEIAHTQGIMRENDANELAYYILLNSEDNYLKYVGYLKTLPYMLEVILLTNNEIDYSKIPNSAKLDIKASREFWDKKDVLEKVGDAINDLYLKMNSQSGTDSYNSYNQHDEQTIVDDDGNQKTIYTVKSFSHVQNMIFALYL